MPQLNPDPWFSTFMMVWTSVLALALPKVLTLICPLLPETLHKLLCLHNWSWQWH
uniref:ATP synthase F0 subunit 8 n=1 Tax=Tentoriceps cristatus TaxID=1183399 RepID=UPI0023AB1C3D|nr:ATP synthase F0 subunit 8 [Tentoriceps cristatus]WCP19593.1 ATP synthase F0 subunit 8 [Tentoriceps cristatus]